MNYELSLVTYAFMFGQLGGDHSGIIPGSFPDYSGSHSRIIPGSFQEHSKITPGSFWDHSGIILPSFWDHSTRLASLPVYHDIFLRHLLVYTRLEHLQVYWITRLAGLTNLPPVYRWFRLKLRGKG